MLEVRAAMGNHFKGKYQPVGSMVQFGFRWWSLLMWKVWRQEAVSPCKFNQPGGFPQSWLEAWEISSVRNSVLGLFLYKAVISKKLSFLSGMQRNIRAWKAQCKTQNFVKICSSYFLFCKDSVWDANRGTLFFSGKWDDLLISQAPWDSWSWSTQGSWDPSASVIY